MVGNINCEDDQWNTALISQIDIGVYPDGLSCITACRAHTVYYLASYDTRGNCYCKDSERFGTIETGPLDYN